MSNTNANDTINNIRRLAADPDKRIGATTPKARKVKEVPVSLSDLAAARTTLIDKAVGAAKAEERKNGAQAAYAAACNKAWGAGWWLVANKKESECNANEKPLRKMIEVERVALFEGLKAKKHPNPSMPWGRTKAYSGEISAGTRDGVTGAQIKGKGANTPKAWKVRATESCSALFKSAQGQTLTAKEKAALKAISEALWSLGVDTATLIKVDA